MQKIKQKVNLENYFIETPGSWFITSQSYPAFFISRFLSYLKNKDINYHFIEDIDVLGCSFLGESQYYWFGSLEEYSSKQKEYILNYLISYEGPHKVGAFIGEDDAKLLIKKKKSVLNLQELFQQGNFNLPWLDSEQNNIKAQTLDKFALLSEYKFLLQDMFAQANAEWPIGEDETESLFSLAKYFFSKDYKFFTLLKKLQDSFSAQFFISYWSDQLFRALFFAYYMKHNLAEEANTIAHKLPFSITQHGWKKLDLNLLQNSLVELYKIDYEIKNGASEFLLDDWYLQYFR